MSKEKRLFFLLFFLFALVRCFSLESSSWSKETQFTLGVQSAARTTYGDATRMRPYLEMAYQASREPIGDGPLLTLHLGCRFWNDFAEPDREIDLRSLSLLWLSDYWSFGLGFQEVSWGETFGFFILDLVNPRDLSDPLFNEIGFIRKPVFMANYQYYWDSTSLQLLFIPIPEKNDLPIKNSAFDVIPAPFKSLPLIDPVRFRFDHSLRYAECGGRLGTLFDCGLDLNLYYLWHWNRSIVFESHSKPGFPVLELHRRRIHSIGVSASQAFEDIVLRGDSVIHIGTPLTQGQFGRLRHGTLWKTILGLDYTPDASWSTGVQLHRDHWSSSSLHWIGMHAWASALEGIWEFNSFLFFGLDNQDFWFQPQLTRHTECMGQWNLRADLLSGEKQRGVPEEGIIGPLRKQHRLFFWWSYSF